MPDNQLPIRAQSDRKFFRRFILLGLGALGFAGWCLYDGLVAWPKKNQIWAAYEAIPEADRPERWPEVAAENGWSSKRPKKKGYHHTEGEIHTQLVMAVPITLVGLWFFWGVWRSRGSWIAADAEGISSSWGQSFAWDDVTKLDKKKWRGKGIAKVHYSQGDRASVFTLDDFKYQREPADAILLQLEERLDREQITGGPTEAEVRAAEMDAPANRGDEAPAVDENAEPRVEG